MTKDLNVLYIGSIWKGSTSRNRMMAIKKCGLSVIEFDTSKYLKTKNRLLNSLSHRFNIGSNITNLNNDIVKFVEQQGHIDIIWIDKGKWVNQNTISYIKELSKAILVHYTPDPQIVAQKSQAFISSIPSYDLMLTTKPYEVNQYKKYGVKEIRLISQSYEKSKLYPRELTNKQIEYYSSPVTFIGHHENFYQEKLEAIAEIDVPIKIWGPYWTKRIKKNNLLNNYVVSEGIWEDNYGIALNASDIGLCLLTKRWPETTTTRTFEIPACGTFMLAERTNDHENLFKEGLEAEFFSSDEEMLEKIRFYINNPSLRERIAKAGYERSINSGYDNHSQISLLIDNIRAEYIK